jgi:hypothetical protein
MTERDVDPSGSTEQFQAFASRADATPRSRAWLALVLAAVAIAVVAALIYLAVRR